MIELVVAVCLIDQPSQCKDVYLNFESPGISEGASISPGAAPSERASVTPQQCMMNGQMEMAKWIGEHPNWQIKKWRCGIAGQMAKI